jgi:cobalt-zinc-cadmium efflux system membrane fusion protein
MSRRFASLVSFRSLSRVLTLALALGSAACSRTSAHEATPLAIPPGEIWLTDAQMGEAKIKIEPLAEQDVDDVIVTSGKVTYDDVRVSHVFSPVSGRISHIAAKPGQRVKKGEALATLESPDIGIASSDLHKADADRIAAEHDLQRQKDLLAAHATSQRDFEASEDNYRKAKAEVERAKQKVGLFHAGGAEAVTQSYTIRSEIDGEVISRNVTPGIEVQGQYGGGTAVELFTVGELDRVWVLADVYEMDTGRVKVGSRVSMKLFAFPNRTFTTTIEWVSGALDPLTRTTKVRCALDNADGALKPEMYATLFISVEERRAIALPRSALVRMGEEMAVFIEKAKSRDGRHVFAKVPVIVDESEGGKWVPVSHGLDLGALIVTEGGILLSGGDGK